MGIQASGNYTYIYVRIRNTSGKALKFLKVTATLEARDNSLISTEGGYMEPQTVEPNGVALVKLSSKTNPSVHHYNLSFESDGREVKFK
jgi:hypothetical protein